MKFLEKYSRLFALLGVISVSTWGLGCANEGTAPAGGSADKTEKKAEAGSTTGGGDEAAKKAGSDKKDK